MAHEFGHWLVLEHLYHGSQPGESGCDEYLATVMYYSIDPAAIKRTLHWIDKWGKWYIYSSGQVSMAPVAISDIPPPVNGAESTLRTRLLQNYPDPFNPETWIPYQLAKDSVVSIEIYDSRGTSVRKFDLGLQERGSYVESSKALHWDGTNDDGETVSSGVYFYTLRADNFSETKRLVILK